MNDRAASLGRTNFGCVPASTTSPMTTPRIASVTAEPFQTPLHNPFVTSQGSATAAQAVAVHLTLDDGRAARGESVPVTYVTGETVASVRETVARVAPEMIGLEIARYRLILDALARLTPDARCARCGLEMAVLDAWTQTTGMSLANVWGGAL